MYGSLTLFSIQQFRSFRWMIFPLRLLAESWKLHKLLKFFSTFEFSSYIQLPLLWVELDATEETLNNDVSKDSTIAQNKNKKVIISVLRVCEWNSPLKTLETEQVSRILVHSFNWVPRCEGTSINAVLSVSKFTLRHSIPTHSHRARWAKG